MKNTIALVLGGGRGSRLYPLTKYRSKPAVPLAGKYRLIDIPLSNCINSGLNRMYVLTQFLSVSLHRHLRQTYRFDQFSRGFVELLAAQETAEEGSHWYQGTADAVRKNLKYIEEPEVDYVLILSGDQLYRMDYRQMLAAHQESQAEVTIAAKPVDRQEARSMGIMRLEETGRVVGFLEKPQTDPEIDIVRMDPAWIDSHGIESNGRDCLASMGIYLFNRDFLVQLLRKTAYKDFGKEVFPAACRTRRVQVHLFDGFWEDIGTIKSFYQANLSLAGEAPPFEFLMPQSPVYTRARFLPPTRFDGVTVRHSLIADGCRIGRDTVIENCVIGLRCVIGNSVSIRNSVIMGADAYVNPDLRASHPVPVGIGDRAIIEGCIVDKNCRIGRGVRVINEPYVENGPDDPRVVIRDGIPVVVKDAVLPDGFELEPIEEPLLLHS